MAQRVQQAGTHVFPGAGSFTIYSVPAGNTLYLDFADLACVATLAAGNVLQLTIDGNAVFNITTPPPGSKTQSFAKPIQAGSTVALNFIASTGTVTAYYSIAGDLR